MHNLKDRDVLKQIGFVGFISIADLRSSKLESVPNDPGVYVVLREAEDFPKFIQHSTGGIFDKREPTVPIDKLEKAWITETNIMYIGKTGKIDGERGIKKRLNEYLDFGAGKSVGHYGGRYIWQLEDANDLIICWLPVIDEDPFKVENHMLNDFESKYDRLPFANIKGPQCKQQK